MTPQNKPLFRSPDIFQQDPNIVAAESTRHGGVSLPPYASLNLGGQGTDSHENIIENNHRFFGALGIPFQQVARSHQIHGVQVLAVDSPGRYDGFDALITDRPNVQLAVTVADCTPILLYDPVKAVVAAIHAGWRGTVGKIVEQALLQMRTRYQTSPKDCLAYVGTCIDFESFEVGSEVAQHFDAAFKKPLKETGKFLVDLKSANRAQLIHMGLLESNIETSRYSTAGNLTDYFSYRFENGQTGRMLATIGMRSKG